MQQLVTPSHDDDNDIKLEAHSLTNDHHGFLALG